MQANFSNIKLEIFGESHSDSVGAIIKGVPVGEKLDLHRVRELLTLRRSSGEAWSTPRKEEDAPVFDGLREEGGMYTVISDEVRATIANKNVRKQDYDLTRQIPRPSHADLPVWAREGQIPSGGGRFSGRMTAPLCVAGGIAEELLERRGVQIKAYVTDIGGVHFEGANDSETLSMRGPDEAQLAVRNRCAFRALDDANAEQARNILKNAAQDGDSVGGIIECCVTGLRLGQAGDAMFDGIEGKLAYAIFAVPAVKGVEFGAGFVLARMRGSQANDPIGISDGAPAPLANRSGGINGGISNGLPIIVRAAIRPTPSISREQRSVDLASMSECALSVKGRHDVCIVPRAVPAIEAAVALAIYDLIMTSKDDLKAGK